MAVDDTFMNFFYEHLWIRDTLTNLVYHALVASAVRVRHIVTLHARPPSLPSEGRRRPSAIELRRFHHLGGAVADDHTCVELMNIKTLF